MKIAALIFLLLFLYTRRSVGLLWKNIKIKNLLITYKEFFRADNQKERMKVFQQIAQNRPLSNDLIGGLYFYSPSYDDFSDEDKLKNTFISLMESFDNNSHWAKKYLHPKYFAKDLFILPASIFGFLLNHKFKSFSSLLLSCLTWIATILISAYANEIRLFIEELIKKIIETV
ncbi:hypothetical protein [Oceanobacillus indicireducens]|uniref:Uncharacterized protein n=1 Tax=Oceanobacillus indicireducens TaxID=1004261 RepID=A0A917XYD6_9BACI|nr:hypothetical protein [Oceanobacillus indicireducens]GGN59529.1 hypothetical protein GCM10007971_22720 [Oceanobacillus indicireducens]